MRERRDERRQERDRLSDMIRSQVFREIVAKETGGAKPQGTVTILFTDIEGSTALLRTLGEAEARSVFRRHDDAVRAAVHAHGGFEVEKAGDGFMLAFSTAREAVACAEDIRQRVSGIEAGDGPLRVRCGLDTGEATPEERGYFGETVFRAARIADLARGSRIVVSEATKALAERAGYRFSDLGEQELKGFGDGHRLFELVGAPELATAAD